MNTWLHNRRFTLSNADLCAQVETLAAACGESTRTYLAELVDVACLEQGQSTAQAPMIVDDIVGTWLATHRSGRPCTLAPITAPSEDCYFLPRGITIMDEWSVAL